MAFIDKTLYTPIEQELRRIVLRMFQDNYTLEEIAFLVEKFVYAFLYCDKGLHNQKVAKILNTTESKAASVRDTFDFTYTLSKQDKEMMPAYNKEKEQVSPEELKKKVMERLQKEGKVSA